MEFHRIRYFLEVCKLGRISHAAKACHVSQPSLSLQIQKLEASLGGSLFLRNREGLHLTELGEAFLPHAQAIMAEVESAHEFRDRQKNGIHGVVKIGAIPTIAPYLLPEILMSIQEQHAAATFDIVEDTTDVLIQQLRSGALDFAVLSPPTDIDQDVDVLEVCRDELLLTLPLEHPLAGRGAVDLDEVKSEPLVLLKESHCLSQQCESALRHSRLNPEIRMRSSQIGTLLGIVEAGMGITFTPKIAMSSHREKKVSFHAIEPNPYFREIQWVWMRRHQLSAKQKAVLACVKKLCGNLGV